MDLEKIGKFISKKRQDNNYTQESLAEKLNISNRSISKWERGICLPDANNMARLCKLFDISYNELLSGEEINQKDYKQHSEKLLEEFSKIETLTNKKFFLYENVIGYCGHRYIPKYSSVYFAMHLGRTRYMTCPKCHKKSWQKKIA